MKNICKPHTVTILIPELSIGGVQKVMITLANSLAKAAFTVNILTMNQDGDYKKTISQDVKIINLNVKNHRYITSAIYLFKYFKKTTIDVFISTLYNEPAILAHKLSKNKCSIITTIHGSYRQEIQHSLRGRSTFISLYLALIGAKYVDAIVAVSQGVAQELIDLGFPSNKISVIYNPIIDRTVFSLQEQTITHPWFIEPHKDPVIISVGRLVPSKGFDILIRAFYQLLKIKKAKLVIIGDGPDKKRLEELITSLSLKNDVSLLGWVKNPHPYLKRSDLFAFASLSEGFAVVLVEALAAGIPVVSTDCNYGPREILLDSELGELVPLNDPQSLCRAMLQKLNAEDHPKEVLQERALFFSASSATEQYTKLIEAVLKNK